MTNYQVDLVFMMMSHCDRIGNSWNPLWRHKCSITPYPQIKKEKTIRRLLFFLMKCDKLPSWPSFYDDVTLWQNRKFLETPVTSDHIWTAPNYSYSCYVRDKWKPLKDLAWGIWHVNLFITYNQHFISFNKTKQ